MSEPLAPAPGQGALSPVRLPEPGRLFELRAARLDALAPAHGVPEWLRLVSRVAAGQAAAIHEIHPALPPLAADRPLARGVLPRDEAWRGMLKLIVGAARGPGLPAPTVETLRLLDGAGPAELERRAAAVLAGDVPRGDVAAAPFVGAALQAWLAALAARIDPSSLAPAEGACPVCGGPPLAGRVQRNDRLRYVTCALCCTEWNVPRVHCTVCDTSAGPEYLHLEAEPGVKAEACPTCRSYLKLFDEEKRPGADPGADDAATLTLDLLLSEEGFHRAGANLYV